MNIHQMLLFISFVSFSLCDSYEVLTTPEVIEGVWNCTRVEVTSDGFENPDTINFSVVFHKDSDGVYVGRVSGTDSEATIEYDDTSKAISFRFGEYYIQNTISETENKVRHCHGTTEHPNWSYTFVIMSSYRCMFTIFDRDSGKITIFRMMRQYETDKMTGFLKFATYFARKVIFKMF